MYKQSSYNALLLQKIKTLNLKIYTFESCIYCQKLKKLLEPYQKYIEFKDYEDYKEEITNLNITSFPTSIANNKQIEGYYPSIYTFIEQFS
jgi:glutaredoxin